MSDIKFATVVEERLYVLLDDQRSAFSSSLLCQTSQHLFRLHNENAVASISVLTWFDDPYFVNFMIFSCKILNSFSVIAFKTVSFRQNTKRIFFKNASVVPINHPEEDSFGSDDAVQRDMVTYSFYVGCRVAGKFTTIAAFVPLVCYTDLLFSQNFYQLFR